MWEEIRDDLARWRADGVRFALATVTRTWHSAPRIPGTAMAVSEAGAVLGSVSGGCVEADVYEVGLRVLRTGVPERLRYGIGDADALTIGLTCGGEIELFVEVVDDLHYPQFDAVLERVRSHRPVVVGTWLEGSRAGTHEVLPEAADAAGDSAPAELAPLLGTTGAHVVEACAPRPGSTAGELLVQSSAAPARMIVFGAVEFATAMTRMGAFLGYRVTVCDARPVFAVPGRFPGADEVVVDWPHRYLSAEIEQGRVDAGTVLCVLTHDPKFDVPLLRVAVGSEAGYIGVMGSRRSQADRLQRLREAGLGEDALARLRAPVGLDLGARTPAETAVSIAAEIIASATGRTGLPLRELTTSIHSAPALAADLGV